MSRPFHAFAVLCWALPAFGCSVITSNLPAGTVIVKGSGTADASASYDATQTYFYSPFHVSGHPWEYTVQPGAYQFRIVDPAEEAALFPALTASELGGIYTSWTYNVPSVADYMVFDSSATSNPGEPQLFTGAVNRDVPGAPGWIGAGWDNAADAYAAAKLAVITTRSSLARAADSMAQPLLKLRFREQRLSSSRFRITA